jgi:hypothetical protein
VRYGDGFDAGGDDRLKEEFTSSANRPNLEQKSEINQ